VEPTVITPATKAPTAATRRNLKQVMVIEPVQNAEE
jgi:hypothetical protein